MQLSDFHYDLPEHLIAHFPLPERRASRLLCVDGPTGQLTHRQFVDILDLVQPGDLLVLNDTRVIPARLFGHKQSGGRVEVMIERILDETRVLALIRASKPPQINSQICLPDETQFVVVARHGDLYELNLISLGPVLDVIERLGQIPLPPYFQRAPVESDKERYQTVYAAHKGSVAAPTAGLHFDEQILAALKIKGVKVAYLTLHVGAGTFLPVRVDNVTEHRMHKEYINVSAELCAQVSATKAQGGRVIAVGTTSARSLEAASVDGSIKPYSGMTDIFIYPGFTFHTVDVLITNFHAPATTLLMLVSAFAGYEHIMQAYVAAVAAEYRFFSYGDAMWLSRK